ncbi:MAG: ImmA/IrrE family metallo-endopeptidase [Candidatus Rokuibacteriota bacterium]
MKTIKTDVDHAEALAEIDRLVEADPAVGTPAAERLQILTLLVRDFESRRFPRSRPTPLEAIRFRMEQQGLSQRDLVPFLGSRSKVSEVLAGKRPLTLSMIRSLHNGLGIPADALLQDQQPSLLEEEDQLQWSRFPVREMVARKWVECKSQFELRDDPEAIVRRFLAPLGGPARVHSFYKRTRRVRSERRMDRHALAAWTLRVVIRGLDLPTHRYIEGSITKEFLREVVQLSWSSRGPLLAQEFLQKHGIVLIIERHLPGTHLDGAAVMADRNRPVIGLTLRYNRIDNFWFCLLHELAHLSLHVRDEADGFYDDLDTDTGDDTSEREADELAGEALVPEAAWAQSPAKNLRSPEAARHLAERLRVHPAIVAGRMRHEAKNFRILNQLVGSGEVRILFQEIWPK